MVYDIRFDQLQQAWRKRRGTISLALAEPTAKGLSLSIAGEDLGGIYVSSNPMRRKAFGWYPPGDPIPSRWYASAVEVINNPGLFLLMRKILREKFDANI